MTRYRENTDLVKRILEIERRLENIERVGQAGNSSIGSGEFQLAGGDLVIKDDDGVEVMRIESGSSPRIKMTPQGDSDTHHAEIRGSDFLGQTVIQTSIERTGVDIDGGKVLLWDTAAVISHQPLASGDPEAYIALGKWPINPPDGEGQAIFFQGRFANQMSVSSSDAFFFGSISVGSGFSGLVYEYPVTFTGNMIPIVSIQSSAVVSWNLTAQDNAGFTVSWSGTTAKIVNFMCIRLDQ